MLHQKRIPIKTFQEKVGKLQHASMVLPAACGFFTPLNNIMRAPDKYIILGEDSLAEILDICTLIHQLSKRPTHVNDLLPNPPLYVAYHDAAAEGAGRVWFSLISSMHPLVWRVAFPKDIMEDVISDKNPSGSITNLDLDVKVSVKILYMIATSLLSSACTSFTTNLVPPWALNYVLMLFNNHLGSLSKVKQIVTYTVFGLILFSSSSQCFFFSSKFLDKFLTGAKMSTPIVPT
jgi:hypothetical protein